MATQGGEEDVLHQGGFSRAAYASDHGQDIERELHVDVLQVMLAGTGYGDEVVPATAMVRYGNFSDACKILPRKAFRTFGDVFVATLANQLAAELAS